MRYYLLVAGFATLLAFGIWQAYAQPGAKPIPAIGPENADLVKHGSYLVNEVAHCSHCHTPVDAQGKFDQAKFLQGTKLNFAPKQAKEEWAEESPDITSKGMAGKWTEEQMIKFLMTGLDPKGHEPMAPM